jgi:hypothetical protein
VVIFEAEPVFIVSGSRNLLFCMCIRVQQKETSRKNKDDYKTYCSTDKKFSQVHIGIIPYMLAVWDDVGTFLYY